MREEMNRKANRIPMMLTKRTRSNSDSKYREEGEKIAVYGSFDLPRCAGYQQRNPYKRTSSNGSLD